MEILSPVFRALRLESNGECPVFGYFQPAFLYLFIPQADAAGGSGGSEGNAGIAFDTPLDRDRITRELYLTDRIERYGKRRQDEIID